MKISKNFLTISAMLVVLVLVGAGCSDEDSATSNTTSQNTTATSTTNENAVAADTNAETNTETNGVSGEGENEGPQTETVEIENFAFSTKEITISVGDSITFVNKDSMQHTATAKDDSFDTGLLSEGESKTITFNKAGTFDYFCQVHSTMTGKVIVQ